MHWSLVRPVRPLKSFKMSHGGRLLLQDNKTSASSTQIVFPLIFLQSNLTKLLLLCWNMVHIHIKALIRKYQRHWEEQSDVHTRFLLLTFVSFSKVFYLLVVLYPFVLVSFALLCCIFESQIVRKTNVLRFIKEKKSILKIHITVSFSFISAEYRKIVLNTKNRGYSFSSINDWTGFGSRSKESNVFGKDLYY